MKTINETSVLSLGTKASQVVVFNKDSVVVTQPKLKQRDLVPQIKFNFEKKHVH